MDQTMRMWSRWWKYGRDDEKMDQDRPDDERMDRLYYYSVWHEAYGVGMNLYERRRWQLGGIIWLSIQRGIQSSIKWREGEGTGFLHPKGWRKIWMFCVWKRWTSAWRISRSKEAPNSTVSLANLSSLYSASNSKRNMAVSTLVGEVAVGDFWS